MIPSFLYSWVLSLLLVPLALLCWTWKRSGRGVVLPFDHSTADLGTVWRFVLSMMESVPPLLLGVAIILLAGPQKMGEPKDKRILSNIELCLDISGSMTAQYGEGSRYDAAMKSLDDFVTYRKGDAFGLTFFGSSNLHWVPLTSDVSAVRCSTPFMRPENVPPWYGGTEIGRALRSCIKVLSERQEGDRMILLVTDGDSFDLNGGADQEIARELRANNITIYAVIIGMNQIQDEIINITHLTGGDAFLAGEADTLKTIFRRIDQMKPTRIEKTIGETQDDFQLPCIVGLALAGLGLISLAGLRYTPW